MSENHDVLQRATRALRDAHSGESARSSFTRARVMRSLHEDKRRRLSRTLVFGPLAALLVGGTAWAAATGQLPELFERAGHWFVSAQAPTGQATAVPQPGRPARHAVPSEAPPVEPLAAPTLEPSAELEPPVEPTVEAAPPPAPAKPIAVRRSRAASRAPEPSPPESSPPKPSSEDPQLPAEIARDPELARFRRAHDLHFHGNAQQAIAAYADYLSAYPSGRFVPEARYNTALNLLKLGQRARAESILRDFAEGRYGAYRREPAKELIDAMHGAHGGAQPAP